MMLAKNRRQQVPDSCWPMRATARRQRIRHIGAQHHAGTFDTMLDSTKVTSEQTAPASAERHSGARPAIARLPWTSRICKGAIHDEQADDTGIRAPGRPVEHRCCEMSAAHQSKPWPHIPDHALPTSHDRPGRMNRKE